MSIEFNIYDCPNEILLNISERLNTAKDLCSVAQVSKRFQKIASTALDHKCRNIFKDKKCDFVELNEKMKSIVEINPNKLYSFYIKTLLGALKESDGATITKQEFSSCSLEEIISLLDKRRGGDESLFHFIEDVMKENVSSINQRNVSIYHYEMRKALENKKMTYANCAEFIRSWISKNPEVFKRVKHIDLSKINHIGKEKEPDLNHIPVQIENFIALESLNMRRNKISEICSSVFSLKNLNTLDLACNEIVVVPDKICKLNNLEWVSFAQNKIKQFPKNIFSLPKLEFIDLSGNLIKEFPEEITFSNSLKEIKLKGNPNETLPKQLAEKIQSLKEDEPVLLNEFLNEVEFFHLNVFDFLEDEDNI